MAEGQYRRSSLPRLKFTELQEKIITWSVTSATGVACASAAVALVKIAYEVTQL
jgi:hypothetical protein